MLVLALAFMPGCQSNMAVKRMAAKNPLSKNSAKTPAKMVDVWKTYAQTTPEGEVMRGVAGRVHFYADGKKKNAVKVDGDLSVFVFDGEQKDPAHAKPLKVYQFTAETLAKHYAFKKPLGHGYDFFLPIDEIGGEEKTLCIMTRFDDRLEGTLVLSPPVNTILKGTKRQTPETPFQEFLTAHSTLGKTKDIEQVAFKNGIEPGQVKIERSVETIMLNDHMTRRLTQAGPEPNEPLPVHQTAPAAALPTDVPKEVESAAWTRETRQARSLKVEKPDYPKVEYPEAPFR